MPRTEQPQDAHHQAEHERPEDEPGDPPAAAPDSSHRAAHQRPITAAPPPMKKQEQRSPRTPTSERRHDQDRKPDHRLVREPEVPDDVVRRRPPWSSSVAAPRPASRRARGATEPMCGPRRVKRPPWRLRLTGDAVADRPATAHQSTRGGTAARRRRQPRRNGARGPARQRGRPGRATSSGSNPRQFSCATIARRPVSSRNTRIRKTTRDRSWRRSRRRRAPTTGFTPSRRPMPRPAKRLTYPSPAATWS